MIGVLYIIDRATTITGKAVAMEELEGAPSVIDLMLFHTTERNLFARLTSLDLQPERMSSVLALWLWLESIGYHHFIRHVYSYQNHVVLRFVREAEACLDCLEKTTTDAADVASGADNNEIPAISMLMNEPIDLGFFEFNRNLAVAGIARINHNVCRIIFDDNLMKQAARDMSHPASRSFMSSSGLVVSSSEMMISRDNYIYTDRPDPIAQQPSSSTSRVQQYSPFPVKSALNPLATPWTPLGPWQTPEDQRSMFITFSKGHPITREDITDFFTTRYGPCIETVMIEKAAAAAGQRPMYGRVVFTSASMISFVLNGQRTAKFMIKGKHLWGRMYVPRHNQSMCDITIGNSK